MQSPPEFIDGARVLQFASLAKSQPTGNTRHVVDGQEVGSFAGVAVAEYENGSGGVYLYYCDQDWNLVTDTLHDDLAAAVGQANFEFGLLRFKEA